MEKETNCPYKKLCMSVYPEQKMNEHRLNCSKDNSYWCPYGDKYDDREEDCRPGGENWEPGMKASHTSLSAFQRKLRDIHGIELSTAKIRKILITGGFWTTERSREVEELYEKYHSITRVASELGMSPELVTMYLPYKKAVYDLEEKSGNARRCEKWRRAQPDK